MRGLFRWAFEAKHVPRDPTAGIKNPKRKKGPGFKKWSEEEEEVERYEARWPIGTKERVWLDVLLYTGLRRRDAVLLGRLHVRNGVATLQRRKAARRLRSRSQFCQCWRAHLLPVPAPTLPISVGSAAIP
jgi:integrase